MADNSSSPPPRPAAQRDEHSASQQDPVPEIVTSSSSALLPTTAGSSSSHTLAAPPGQQQQQPPQLQLPAPLPSPSPSPSPYPSSRPSDATLEIPVSPSASSTTAAGTAGTAWSPVSITASHPAAPNNIRLSPEVEEEIKAAVLEAAANAQQHQQQSKKKKRKSSGGEYKRRRKGGVRRAPDGRRESPQTTRNWLIAKKVLRWVSLTICGMMVVGEAVLAIFNGAYADTTVGICLGFLLGIWDTLRLVRLRLKRDVEPVSIFHLLIEGTFTIVIVVAVACIVDRVRRYWDGEVLIRGWVFSAGMLLQECIHITLFSRACVDKYLHRDAVDFRRYHGWELPWYADPQQPTEVVVKYVHVCPHCESEYSPYADAAEGKASRSSSKGKQAKRGDEKPPPPSVPAVVVTE